MTWNGHKLTVDLVPIAKHWREMPPLNTRFKLCSPKKGTLIKIVLTLALVGLIVQCVQMYLTVSWYAAIKELKEEVKARHPNSTPTPATKHYNITKERSNNIPNGTTDTRNVISETKVVPITRAVIYSYWGIQNLPQGDLIPQILQTHPQVFYIHNLDRWISRIFPTFPKHNQRNMKKTIEDSLSCDHSLLNKLQEAAFITDGAPIRHHSAGCHRRGCAFQAIECESKAVRIIDTYKGSGEPVLQDIFFMNDSIKLIHLAADPRLVILNLWQRQKLSAAGSKPFSVIKDAPVAKKIAKDYCIGVLRDIKAIRKLRNSSKNGRPISQRYMFTRYEDLIRNPVSIMKDIFTFLDLNMTEEMRESVEAIADTDISLLYQDAEYNINEIAEQYCLKSMEFMGYLTKNQTGESGEEYVRPFYTSWWE